MKFSLMLLLRQHLQPWAHFSTLYRCQRRLLEDLRRGDGLWQEIQITMTE